MITREDIESLGWNLDQKVKNDWFFVIGNIIEGDWILSTSDFQNFTITPMIGNPNPRDFEGIIKNREELQDIMLKIQIQ